MSTRSREYWEGLPLAGQLRAFEQAWGARPYMAIDVVEVPGKGTHVAVQTAILHPLLRAELAEPDAVMQTHKLTYSFNLQQATAAALAELEDNILKALSPF